MSELRRIQITHIHEGDAHYSDRSRYIGLKGEFQIALSRKYKGYYSGAFYPDNSIPHKDIYFLAVRYKRI